MQTETNSSSPRKSNSTRTIVLIVAIVVVCLVVLCCILVIAGVLLFQPATVERIFGPIQPVAPPGNVPVIASTPTLSSDIYPTGTLIIEGEPLYWSADLQRGFSPDPSAAPVGAGGYFDTSLVNLPCGFTTEFPTAAFHLYGGASEGFLRIYFVSSDSSMDATLILYTPGQEWLCADSSSSASGAPLIDMEFAASGRYVVWVGITQSEVYAPGMLYITQSRDNTP